MLDYSTRLTGAFDLVYIGLILGQIFHEIKIKALGYLKNLLNLTNRSI